MMKYIGMRTLKTGLTVFLAALIARVINPDDQFVILFTSLIALESTVSSSFENGWKRIVASIVGAVVANILVFSALPFEVAAALAIMLLIIVSNRLGQSGSIGVAGSVTILILLSGYSGADPAQYSLIRIRDTVIAIALAGMVNLLIFPPKASKRIRELEKTLYGETLAMVEKIYLYRVGDNLEEYRKAIDKLEEEVREAGSELGIVKSLESPKLKLYKKLIAAYQAIYIYSENLSLMGQDMRATDANLNELTAMFAHEKVLDNNWDETTMTNDEAIYNNTLNRLILELKKLRSLGAELETL